MVVAVVFVRVTEAWTSVLSRPTKVPIPCVAPPSCLAVRPLTVSACSTATKPKLVGTSWATPNGPAGVGAGAGAAPPGSTRAASTAPTRAAGATAARGAPGGGGGRGGAGGGGGGGG